MKDSLAIPLSAVVFGVVLGIAGTLPLQAVQNVSATRHCQQQQQTHKLVSVRGFWGDSLHCVDRLYL